MTPSHSDVTFIDEGFLELVSIIGTGAYGVVYLAIDHRYGQPVYRAVKCLRRKGLDARQRHFQRREIALHRLACSHPSIITMDRLVEEGDFLYVVMDYGEEGDLFAMITDHQRYVGDDELIRDVFLQLLDGVEFLHQLGIAHRDIKPENIVCSNDGQQVYICDFGLATSEVTSSEFGCGSTFYIAPESLGGWSDEKTYATRPGDVWSLGIILVNLVCGRNPWRSASPDDESFNTYLKDETFLRRILPISRQCQWILSQIFTLDPAQRITLPELRKLILDIDTFSMEEEELRLAHIQAQISSRATEAAPPYEELAEEWTQGSVFAFDQETPSLRGDTDSPYTARSRSTSSNGGSLPPTPLMTAEGTGTLPPPQQIWDLKELLKPPVHREVEVRLGLASPDPLSASQGNPFFR